MYMEKVLQELFVANLFQRPYDCNATKMHLDAELNMYYSFIYTQLHYGFHTLSKFVQSQMWVDKFNL